MVNTWKSKTVLITGASFGIGEAFAHRFAAEGAKMVLTARSGDRLNAIADELRAKHGIEIVVIEQDLALPDAAQALLQETDRRELVIDLLINNAGFGAVGDFIDLPLARQLEMIQVNIIALVELSYFYLHRMIERRDGAIIQVASTASFQGVPYSTLYAATKAFVLNFSEGLWGECQHLGVTVLALCPGPTATHFQAVAGTSEIRDHEKMQAPEQVVEVALKALLQRRSVAVSGFSNRAMVFAERFAPRNLITRLAGKLYASASSRRRE